MMFNIKSQKGQSLIELLIVMAMSAIVIPALFFGIASSREGKTQEDKRLLAVSALEETMEAVRSVREGGWDSFAVNGTFHPEESDSSWTLVSGADATASGITRQVDISNVYRDSNGAIASASGTLDPSTKKVVITVSWSTPHNSSLSTTAYLTRYLDNLSFTQTTEADFDPGTQVGTAVTNTSGGEVVLGGGGKGDWCKPGDFIVAQHDLPQNGAARRVKAIEGEAFTGTNQGGTGTFVQLGISNDDTPVITTENTITGYETRDVFIDGNYAYVATADVSRDVVIIDLSTGTEVGYFNDPDFFGTTQGVFVKGNVGYAVIGPRLHTFDLSSKTGSRPQLDSIHLRPGFLIWIFVQGYRLQVVGNYAYVALSGWTDAELRLVNISNPNNLSLGAYANVTNGEDGREIFVNSTGTRAYLATTESSSQREFFIINSDVSSTNKNNQNYSLQVISSYDTNGMDPQGGVAVVTGNRAILVGTGHEEYQVVDITDENNPVRCGGTDVDSGIYGLSTVLEADGDAYSYIVTGDSSNEFKIIEGGPGEQYADEGTFESNTFDALVNTAFNRFDATVDKLSQTDIEMQVAVANAVSGSCDTATYDFVGPDKTSNTFFTESGGKIEGAIPLMTVGNYSNPGRCIRYKAFLSTEDSSRTPVFEDIIVNYSP